MGKAIPRHTAASGPTAPVPKDPQPSVDRIDDLARRILTGDILLPKFQRSFVWDRPQIITLLDSVARGYPIGSVLLWQSRQELRSEKRIADLDIELPRPDYPVNYLLDGQQRLSAICGAMHWRGTDPESRWNVAYDLRDQAFQHLDTLDDPPLHQIRINKLADPAAFFRHVASLDNLSSPDKGKLKQRAELLFNRFKDYKIATVTLGDMSIEDVAPIFERINSTGTALTIVDLMRAATWSPDFDLIESIESILDDLASKNFATVDKKVVLRSISASAGGGFSADSIDQLRNYSSDQLKAAVADAADAYRCMVDFLVTHIRVPNAEVIPYSNQLTVLSEVFRRLPVPSAAQYAAIERWFWRTSVAGYFSGWNTGSMASDLTAIKTFAEGSTELQTDAMKPSSEIWVVRQFRLNNAHAKLLALLLSYRSPIDLLSGMTIDTTHALSWGNAKEFHHFFPQEFLKSRKEPSSRINSLANIVMLTSTSNKQISGSAPSSYLPRAVAALGDKLESTLASNLISRDAFECALRDDYDGFLNARANAIHHAAMKQAGWLSKQDG